MDMDMDMDISVCTDTPFTQTCCDLGSIAEAGRKVLWIVRVHVAW